MRRRRHTQLGFNDGVHRDEASASTSGAELDLHAFAQSKTCNEKLRSLRNAAEQLADAVAHQRSIEAKTRDDKLRQKRLHELNLDYRRAWDHVRHRCTRK